MGGWALEQAHQGSDHSTKPDRVQGVFGQYSQAHGVIIGVSCAGPGLDLKILEGPFQFSLFGESVKYSKLTLSFQGIALF